MHKNSSHERMTNCFFFAGMIDSGLGETHINKFLAALGIPPVNHKLLKRREREFGSHVESLARESCSSAQLEEAKLSPLSLDPESQNAIGIDVSYDVGWQQRGSGNATIAYQLTPQ